MKRKIRRGCFQTNSSSEHVLCLMKTDKPVTEETFENEYFYLRNDGILDYTYEEDDFYFGRSPFRVLCTFRDKLMFVIASYCGGYTTNAEEEFEKILKIVQEINPNIKGIKLPKSYYYDKIFYGDIDHQSAGLLQKFLVSHNLTIKDFLSNGKYIVIITGDEYTIYDDLKDFGLINLDNIEEEFKI